MQVVNNFIETHSNQQVFLLVAGDLNMSMEEICKGDRHGDSFCEILVDLFHSSLKATSFRSKSNPRTIDWMFTSLKQKHVEVKDFDYQLSDHRATISKVQLYGNDYRTRVPNKKSASAYLRRLSEDNDGESSIQALNTLIKRMIR